MVRNGFYNLSLLLLVLIYTYLFSLFRNSNSISAQIQFNERQLPIFQILNWAFGIIIFEEKMIMKLSSLKEVELNETNINEVFFPFSFFFLMFYIFPFHFSHSNFHCLSSSELGFCVCIVWGLALTRQVFLFPKKTKWKKETKKYFSLSSFLSFLFFSLSRIVRFLLLLLPAWYGMVLIRSFESKSK